MYYPCSEKATAKLICFFVFAYAKCWFSHDAAQFIFCMSRWSSDSFSDFFSAPSSTQLPTMYGSNKILLQEILSTKESEQSSAVPSTEISEVPPNSRRLSASQTGRVNLKLSGNRQFLSTTAKTAPLHTSSITTVLTLDSDGSTTRYDTSSIFVPGYSTTSTGNAVSSLSNYSSSSSPKTSTSEYVGSALSQFSPSRKLTQASSSSTKTHLYFAASSSQSATVRNLSHFSSTKSLIFQSLSSMESDLHPVTSVQSPFTKGTPHETVTIIQTSEQTVKQSLSVKKNDMVSDKTSFPEHLVDTVENRNLPKGKIHVTFTVTYILT